MKNQKTIVQVLGKVINYSKVKFCLKDRVSTTESVLSSVAYNELTDQNGKFLFYIPESMIVQILEDPSELKDFKNIEENLITYYKKKLSKIIEDSIDFDLEIIPSIGSYAFQNKETNFNLNLNNYIDNIIIKFYTDLLEIEGELILDISTGPNLYTQSLTDVAKSLIVYHRLKNILQNHSEYSVKLLIVPPIYGTNKDQIFPIEVYNYKAKTFFDIPYKNLDINNNLIDFSNINSFKQDRNIICRNAPKLEKTSKDLIYLTLLSFNAIKYNTPLAFFEKELIKFTNERTFLNEELVKIKNVSSYLKECLEIEINENQINIQNLRALRTDLINYTFTLSLYKSFQKFFQEIVNEKPTIDFIKTKFSELYNNLGLGSNKRFLERDLKSLRSYKEQLDINQIKPLNLIMKRKSEEIERKEKKNDFFSDEKRNFFAHSGFQRNFIQLKKNEQQNLEIYYIHNFIERIRNWLLNPEN